MNTSTKFAGFALGLVALFGVAAGVGTLVGSPENETETPHTAAPDLGASAAPGGLTAEDGGYRLVVTQPVTEVRRDATLRFRIEDLTGTPVTQYTTEHEKDLHLIVVRRDLTGYRHLHPALGTDGTWSTPLPLDRAGDHRIFADFVTADGQAFTLGTDLRIAGDYRPQPQPLPPPRTTATVGDYTVELTGTPAAGRATDLAVTVSRNGRPVTDLEPYLGAYGHLVALRAADLGYLHVHPTGHPGDGTTAAGPEVRFTVAVPSAGDYRLFFEFRHAGTVHRAELTVSVPTGNHTSQPAPEPTDHGH